MLAYFIPTENRYVRTQGEAKKLGFGEATDVPTTDKDAMLAFLNTMRDEWARDVLEARDGALDNVPTNPIPGTDWGPQEAIPAPSGTPVPPTPQIASSGPDFGATAVLSRMDNPGLDLDAVIEKISRMKGGHALKRVAGAVAMRFEELAK